MADMEGRGGGEGEERKRESEKEKTIWKVISIQDGELGASEIVVEW